MSKIAVYFPGIGYLCDKPLLYYSRSIACGLGYKDYRNVNYTYKAGNIRGNEEKMKEAYEVLFLQAESDLADIPWSEYGDVLFISKRQPHHHGGLPTQFDIRQIALSILSPPFLLNAFSERNSLVQIKSTA